MILEFINNIWLRKHIYIWVLFGIYLSTRKSRLMQKKAVANLSEGLGLCPLPQGHSIFMRWWAATHLFTEVVEEAWPPPPHPLFFERAEEM
jgi:hypothetical protein